MSQSTSTTIVFFKKNSTLTTDLNDKCVYIKSQFKMINTGSELQGGVSIRKRAWRAQVLVIESFLLEYKYSHPRQVRRSRSEPRK